MRRSGYSIGPALAFFWAVAPTSRLNADAHDLVGRNVIARANGGCTIHESYATPTGYVGTSLNAFDASRERWNQTWSDNTGLYLRLEGTSLRPGVMRLEGARTDAQHRAASRSIAQHRAASRSIAQHRAASRSIAQHRADLERITWTSNPDGSVRQLWESSSDNGVTWATSFDRRYVRTATER